MKRRSFLRSTMLAGAGVAIPSSLTLQSLFRPDFAAPAFNALDRDRHTAGDHVVPAAQRINGVTALDDGEMIGGGVAPSLENLFRMLSALALSVEASFDRVHTACAEPLRTISYERTISCPTSIVSLLFVPS